VIIVAGSVRVDAAGRDSYLDGCREVVAAARETVGCLDSGPSGDQLAELREIRVSEYEVREEAV
jgi:hypothetical protein